MKKIAFVAAFAAMLCAAFLSCASKPAAEPQPEPKTTVESIYVDGKVFSGYVFKDIASVVITPTAEEGAEPITLAGDGVTYNRTTTEVAFKDGSWGNAQRYPDASFTIVGTIATPAQYVLYGAVPTKPLVAIAGKLQEDGTGYRYDEASRRLQFIVPLDVENDSYSIYWKRSETDIVGIVNKKEDHEAEYDALYAAWDVPVATDAEATTEGEANDGGSDSVTSDDSPEASVTIADDGTASAVEQQ